MDQYFLIRSWLAFVLLGCAVSHSGGQDFANDIVDRDRPQIKQPAAPSQVPDSQASNRARVVAAVVKELNELIPGEGDRGKDHQALLAEIANALVQGDSAAIDSAFTRLEAIEPSLPPKGLLLAGANFTVSNAKGGQALLERTAIDYPDHPSLSLAFSRLAISQGRLTDALALVEKAASQLDAALKQSVPSLNSIEQNHYKIQTLDAMHVIAMRQKRLDDALALATQWEELDPKNPKMMVSRAETEFQRGDIEKCLYYLGKFRATVPDSRPTELVLATWYQQQGDLVGTEEWVNKAAKNYPENPSVQLEYGSWALSREDFTTAEQAIATVEAKVGAKPNTNLMKGRIAFAKGDYPAAEKLFEVLYQQQPNSFDISNMYALTLAESTDSQKKNQAVQLARRNVQGLPDNQIAQAAFGWALLKGGNVQDAKTVLSRVARMPRLPPEIAYYLAVLLEQQGEGSQAKIILEPAIESQGMFLYRGKAKELLKRVESTSGSPDPNG
ncbi:MAG: tetratricopeptide repeat protein [Mariniblastus sp.]|nr:tetratricopeptide repeat protein [Mariniblastus sp.]